MRYALFQGTVPVRYALFTGTVPVNNFFLVFFMIDSSLFFIIFYSFTFNVVNKTLNGHYSTQKDDYFITQPRLSLTVLPVNIYLPRPSFLDSNGCHIFCLPTILLSVYGDQEVLTRQQLLQLLNFSQTFPDKLLL